MHEALRQMLLRYRPQRLEDYTRALREILQEISLLGLWRSKFFEKAAFYGGSSLRILYGLDRFSEDLDFSALTPMPDFDWARYVTALEKELLAFGLELHIETKDKALDSPIRSAFLKANTLRQLMVIQADRDILDRVPSTQLIRIRLEIDTDPPPGFGTEVKYLLRPIPFPVRTYVLSDLFAGKMHALLCRRWKNRVKGRDWYDLVWFVTHHPQLHLSHLEHRMRQTGHLQGDTPLSEHIFRTRLHEAIHKLDVDQARTEVEPFIHNPEVLQVWSRDFFLDIVSRIVIINE